MRKIRDNHPAFNEARTIYGKTVKPVSMVKNVLKPASDNNKLGKGFSVIQKGDWKGMSMFSLTLEERKTCPPSCLHWKDCYGNNMRFAHRIEHGPELEKRLELELDFLASHHKIGFVVRLHVLGDFYSPEYVLFWARMLKKHKNLRIFGYTARWDDIIGINIRFLNTQFRDRCVIRFSRNEEFDGENKFAANDKFEGKAITCPEQTGKTQSCLTCGLCWKMNTTVKFNTH